MRDEDQDQIEEVVDGELVEHPVPRRGASIAPPGALHQGLVWARTPAAQNAMAAATGFVAGAATLALARRYGSRRLERALAAAGPEEPLLSSGAQRGAGRTYLVHVRPLPTLGPGPWASDG